WNLPVSPSSGSGRLEIAYRNQIGFARHTGVAVVLDRAVVLRSEATDAPQWQDRLVGEIHVAPGKHRLGLFWYYRYGSYKIIVHTDTELSCTVDAKSRLRAWLFEEPSRPIEERPDAKFTDGLTSGATHEWGPPNK